MTQRLMSVLLVIALLLVAMNPSPQEDPAKEGKRFAFEQGSYRSFTVPGCELKSFARHHPGPWVPGLIQLPGGSFLRDFAVRLPGGKTRDRHGLCPIETGAFGTRGPPTRG